MEEIGKAGKRRRGRRGRMKAKPREGDLRDGGLDRGRRGKWEPVGEFKDSAPPSPRSTFTIRFVAISALLYQAFESKFVKYL